jgi:mRNA interferase RelE/StbE
MLVFTKQAVKALQQMPRENAHLIRAKLDQITVDPYAAHPNVTRLQGREGYRLRVGNWRVIYDLENGRSVMTVLKIDLRGEVYR